MNTEANWITVTSKLLKEIPTNDIPEGNIIEDLYTILNNFISSKQIFTIESIYRALTDLFFIKKSIELIERLYGSDELKVLIKSYIDFHRIESVLSANDLLEVSDVLIKSDASIRQMVYLKNCLKSSISKTFLINIFKCYNLEQLIKIYDKLSPNKTIDVVNEIFRPIETLESIPEHPIVVIIPSHNNRDTFKCTLDSLFNQTYTNFRLIFIDDNSDIPEIDEVRSYINQLNKNFRTILLSQEIRQRQGAGKYIGYHMAYDDEIVLFVDGDDRLIDCTVMKTVSSIYTTKKIVSTYGCFVDLINNKIQQIIKGTSVYPESIIEKKQYRYYRYIAAHLRTGFAKLFKNIKLVDLLDKNNKFYHLMTDFAEMIPVHEMATPDNIHNKLKYFDVIKKPLYIYNKDNSLKYNTSYARQNEIANEYYKQYRLDAAEKIRSLKKYKFILKQSEIISKNQSNTNNITEYFINVMRNYNLDLLIISNEHELETKIDVLKGFNTNDCLYLTGKIINHHVQDQMILKAIVTSSIDRNVIDEIKKNYVCMVRNKKQINYDNFVIAHISLDLSFFEEYN